MSKNETPNFEKAMEELEALVHTLEAGDMPLEDALKAFEKGTKLVEGCQKQLEEAQMRVEKIMAKKGEEPEIEPFENA